MKYLQIGMVVWLMQFPALSAQDLSFFHLDKSDGLSDNTITSVVSDTSGLIWVATLNGLNSYDGYTVRNFYVRDYPSLQSNIISRLVCDTKNRIWIQAVDGRLSVLDEKRQFHAINLKEVSVDYLLPVSDMPMFLSSGRMYGLAHDGSLNFIPLVTSHEALLKIKFERINPWDTDKLVFTGEGQLFLFDFRTLRVSASVRIPGVLAASRLSADTAMVTTHDSQKLLKVNIRNGEIIKSYGTIKDQYGTLMDANPGSIQSLNDRRFLIASPKSGVYTFDVDHETLIRYSHDPLDDRSMTANQTTYLFDSKDGFDFIATAGSGLSYFKRKTNQARIKSVFHDAPSGRIYNDYINSIAEETNDIVWLGGNNTLIRWNKRRGETTFFEAGTEWGRIRALYADSKTNRIWIGTAAGLVVLDQVSNKIIFLNKSSDQFGYSVNSIVKSPNGLLWVCTSSGMYNVNPESFEFYVPPESSPLAIVQNRFCNVLWFQDENNMWVGTRNGAFHINVSTGKIETFTTHDGLAFDEVTGFAEDDYNNLYIGTRFGFHILKSGLAIDAFKQVNDTWPIDCHAMVKDNDGNIWFSNRDYVAFYSPSTKRFSAFDNQAGISSSGFQFYAAALQRNGELLFGLNKGITYFKPETIQTPDAPVSVMIHEMSSMNRSLNIASDTLKLPHTANSVSFSFSAINLLRGKNILYQYRLTDVDHHWTKASSVKKEVSYHNLNPGQYTFHVRASADGIQWKEAVPVSFIIMTPWWKSAWFLFTGLMLVLASLLLVDRWRTQKIRQQRDQLEVEQAINYLATSLHEQETEDDILWDVARNCIGRLRFEDCVIYLLDEERQVLVQKAAWGPKTSAENKIVHPIEIPLGKGIVGYVAATRQPEIVNDTSVDPRYIVDDVARLSEIAVPIIFDNRVLGVIDSEHATKSFFTRTHLSILTTLAGICANKIIRLRAEEEKRDALMAALVHERKMVEAQLKSLRLQMNPHFLFNSLNTIQQMILSRDETGATKYLSKFSRLLRLILGHADKETLMLKEELETLKLYIELESLRFKDTFSYSIVCDETIDPEEVRIPSMLVQPFVENAIWHGLLNKQGDRKLSLKFSEDVVENLVCVIEDNGIGREAARRFGSAQHAGRGIATATERLTTYNVYHAIKQSQLSIEDLKDEDGLGTGTRIILTLPLQ